MSRHPFCYEPPFYGASINNPVVIHVLHILLCGQNNSISYYHFPSLENKEIHYNTYITDHISQFRCKYTTIILVLGKSSFPITNYMSRASACNAFGSLAHNVNFASQIFIIKYTSTIHHILHTVNDILAPLAIHLVTQTSQNYFGPRDLLTPWPSIGYTDLHGHTDLHFSHTDLHATGSSSHGLLDHTDLHFGHTDLHGHIDLHLGHTDLLHGLHYH